MDSFAGIDSSLAVLIGLTALGAGAVGFVTQARPRGSGRALAGGAGVALAIVAAFAAMIGLAYVSVIATDLFAGLASGAVAYPMLRLGLGRNRAVAAATSIGLIMTAVVLVVSYLGVMAFIAAISVYALIRTRVRPAPALIVTGTTLSGLLAGAALIFWIGLQGM